MTCIKKIELANGAGHVSVEFEVNFPALDKSDRELVGNLIYLIHNHESKGKEDNSPELA